MSSMHPQKVRKSAEKYKKHIKPAEKSRKSFLREKDNSMGRTTKSQKADADWADAQLRAIVRQKDSVAMHPSIPAGLGIAVSPKGKAIWFYRFRGPDHKEIDKKLANVSLVEDDAKSLTQATAMSRFRSIYAAAFSVATPGGLTFKQAFGRWIVEHRKTTTGEPLLEATVEYYQEGFDRYLKEAHGWVLSSKKTFDWLDLLNKVRARSKSKARGMMFMVGSVYAHFIDLEVLIANPIAKTVMRTTFAGKDSKGRNHTAVDTVDLPAFYSAVQQLRVVHGREAIMALVLSGWRRSAVLQARWDCLDLAAGTYTVKPGMRGWKGLAGNTPAPEPKPAKEWEREDKRKKNNQEAHLVAVGQYAVALLSERKERMSKEPGGLTEWVFPSRMSNSKDGKARKQPYLTQVRGALESVSVLLGYHLTPQDLRRTFITIGELALDGDIRMLGRLVGHRVKKTESEQTTRQVEKEGSVMTESYLVPAIERERLAATQVQQMLYELAGVWEMDDDTKQKLVKVGIDPRRLTLTDALGDDPDEEDDEDEVGEEEALVAS
jgi:integrase